MSLFLLAAPPIAYVLMVISADDGAEIFASVVKPLLRGVVVWIVAYIVYLFVAPLLPIRYTPGRIYGYYLFHDFLYWTVAGIAGYLLIQAIRRDRPDSPPFIEYGAYALGLFLLQPVVDLIGYHKILNAYHLFLHPMLRILTVYVFASLVYLSRDASPFIKIGAFAGIVAAAFVFPAVPLLYVLRYPLYSYLLAGVLTAGVAALYLYLVHVKT